MVPVYRLLAASEVPVLTALMNAYGVRHHVQGGVAGAMFPALQDDFNIMTLMVDPEQEALARELLRDFNADV